MYCPSDIQPYFLSFSSCFRRLLFQAPTVQVALNNAVIFTSFRRLLSKRHWNAHSVIFTFLQAPTVQVALHHAFCHFYLISRAYCPSSIEWYIRSFLSHFRCIYSAQVALNHAFCHLYLISGAYCPSGTEYAYQFPCPAGTYNNLTQANDMYDCLPCPGRSALAVALFGS